MRKQLFQDNGRPQTGQRGLRRRSFLPGGKTAREIQKGEEANAGDRALRGGKSPLQIGGQYIRANKNIDGAQGIVPLKQFAEPPEEDAELEDGVLTPVAEEPDTPEPEPEPAPVPGNGTPAGIEP